MARAEQTELVERTRLYLDAVWTDRNTAAIPRFFHDDVRVTGLQGTELYGLDEFRSFHAMILAQFASIRCTIETALSDPPWACVSGALLVRAEADGAAEIETRYMVTARFDDGRIVELISFIDFFVLFEDLGRLPPRTFDRLLTGGKIGKT